MEGEPTESLAEPSEEVPKEEPAAAAAAEAEEFTQQDRETVRNAFHIFDTDGDGKISVDELGTLLRALGQNPTEEQVEELLAVNSL